MEKTFQNKIAIITGASIGIGFEIACQLAAQATLVLVKKTDSSNGDARHFNNIFPLKSLS